MSWSFCVGLPFRALGLPRESICRLLQCWLRLESTNTNTLLQTFSFLVLFLQNCWTLRGMNTFSPNIILLLKCYFPGQLLKMFVTNPHHWPMKPKIEPKLKKISHVKSFGDSLFCTLMDGLSHHLGRWPLSVDSERSTEVKVIGELRKGPPPSHAERSCQSFTQA